MDNTTEKIGIEIFGNTAVVTCSNYGDRPVKKTLKVETLVKAFQEQGTGIETPMLPVNTLKYKERGNTAILVVYSHGEQFTAKHGKDTYEDCIRPNIIMAFDLAVKNGGYSLSKTRCYGVKEKPLFLTDQTPLFQLPFPNIGHGGWVCWGSNKMNGTFKSLTGLGTFVDKLFNAPFNNDLFQGSLFRHCGFDTPKGLFEFLKGKDEWPQELFVNSSNRLTIGSL